MEVSMDHQPFDGSGSPRRPRRSWVWKLLASVVLVALVAGLTVSAYRLGEQGAEGVGTVDVPAAEGEATSEPSGELDALVEVYEELRSEAVEAPDDEELIESGIEGMLEALDDPYAEFYAPAEYASFSDTLDGTYGGVGMELEETPEGLIVVTVFEGTPAEEAGVRSGDRIVEVDGEDVRDAPITSVVEDVRGEEGTDVVLGLERDGEDVEVTVTRAEISIPRIEAELLDDELGHVRLFQFTSGAADDLRGAVEEVVERGAQGVVLDLRGNPGGLLREAVAVGSVFIEDEPIVIVESGDETETLEASGEAVDVPLVVLVDQGTASASEIVAGAVQHAGRGQVVGEPTFGKGTVQAIRSLSDGSGLKFTNARYLTPGGESIEETGVEPDRLVEDPENDDEYLDVAREELQRLMAEASE